MTHKKREAVSHEPLANFETKVKQIETQVQKLRDGKGSLEESLKQYEEGVRMIQECLTAIETMEKRVAMISKGEDGSVTETPVDE